MLLLARTAARDQVKNRTDGLSVFLLDLRALVGKGIAIRPIRTMINHSTTEVFFDNVHVPTSALIGEEGKGFRYILSGMNAERILIAAECIGDAKWFLERRLGLCERPHCLRSADRREPGCPVPIGAGVRSFDGRGSHRLSRRGSL